VSSIAPGERGDERGHLHGDALGLESHAVREQHAAAGDLCDREVDEDDAAREHLRAQRDVRRGHQQARGERGPEDGEVETRERHPSPLSNRCSVSS
jgi:hypothetical protein